MTSDSIPQKSFFHRFLRNSSKRSAAPAPATVDFGCANRIVKHVALRVMPLGQTLSIDEEICLRRSIEGASIPACSSYSGVAKIWSECEYQSSRDFASLIHRGHRIGANPRPEEAIGKDIIFGPEVLKAPQAILEKLADARDEFLALMSGNGQGGDFCVGWIKFLSYVIASLTLAWMLIVGMPFIHALLAAPSPSSDIGTLMTGAGAEALRRYSYFSHAGVIKLSYILFFMSTVLTYPILRILKLR